MPNRLREVLNRVTKSRPSSSRPSLPTTSTQNQEASKTATKQGILKAPSKAFKSQGDSAVSTFPGGLSSSFSGEDVTKNSSFPGPIVEQVPPKKPPRLAELLAAQSSAHDLKQSPAPSQSATTEATIMEEPLQPTYAYGLDPALHPSQQPSQVPRVRRNTVRNIVAQFNEEAKKREVVLTPSTRQHDLSRDNFNNTESTFGGATSSAESDANPSSSGVPPYNYSGTSNGKLPSQKPTSSSNLGLRSRSEYDIQTATTTSPPSELVYAQVVVNGNGALSNKGSSSPDGVGRYKTTVHTRVPNRNAVTAIDGSRDSRKLFSKSTSSLHSIDEGEDHRNPFGYRQKKLGKKATDQHSYYKFDPVDEEYVHPIHREEEISNDHGQSDWSTRHGGSQVRVRHSSLGRESDDLSFESSRHWPVQLKDTNGLMQGNTRNVEKWSEKEEGPHSRKFTEHEYVHEVSTYGNKPGDLRSHITRISPFPGKKDLDEDRGATPDILKNKSPFISRPTGLLQPISSSDNVMNTRRSDLLTEDPASWRATTVSPHPASPYLKKSSKLAEDMEFLSSKKSIGSPKLGRYYFGDLSKWEEGRHRNSKFRSSDNLNFKGLGHPFKERQRRYSTDSGSGVGLLSSRLVRKADAEVNGYTDDDFSWNRYQRGDRSKTLQVHRYEDQENDIGEFRSTKDRPKWLDKPGYGIVGPVTKYEDGHSPPLRVIGNSTEEHRSLRKDETEKVTRQVTHRTSRPSREARERDDGSSSPSYKHYRSKHRSSSQSSVEGDRLGHRSSSRKPETNGYHAVDGTHSRTRIHDSKSESRKTDTQFKERTTKRHYSEELDDKMETSESEAQLYGGSQDSHMSVASRLSSADEKEEDELIHDTVIHAHRNTPQSLVKQLDKQQISYENSQHRQDVRDSASTAGHRLWFERGTDDVDDVQMMSMPRMENGHRSRYNQNEMKNDQWTSATMSRLETSKNRRNVEANQAGQQRMASTLDRWDPRWRKGGGHDIRIHVSDHDVTNGLARSSSFNSRVGSYHSENESQHSNASSSASKPKRVNFASRSGRSRHGGGSRAYGSSSNLSPIHREALLRGASPIRAPSTTSSLKSNDSEASHASNKSVILHATAVADIPPARQYRQRSANTSPVPPSTVGSSGGDRQSRTVQRSFSLLSPWKPRKYKEKYEKSGSGGSSTTLENGGRRFSYNEEQRHHASKHRQRSQERDTHSHNSSSERLDALAPLPSEVSSKSKSKKKGGILRRHSMPKDSRFANFFRRKKEPKTN